MCYDLDLTCLPKVLCALEGNKSIGVYSTDGFIANLPLEGGAWLEVGH